MSPPSKAPESKSSSKAASKTKAAAKSAPKTAAKAAKPKAEPKAPQKTATKAEAEKALKAKIAAAEAPEPKARKPRGKAPAKQPDQVEKLQALIVGRLEDDKAEDVVVIDLTGKSPMADFIVVCSGRSQRHVAAMADHLTRAIKEEGFGRAKVEGLPQADWVLIDAGDIIVHLFRPEVRAFYQIEKIWSVEPGQSGHLVSST